MLEAWVQPTVQTWLDQSRATLRQWKARQIEGLNALGWTCLPSQAPYFCARPALAGGLPVPVSQWDAWLATIRTQGIKLRDAASFGLPGHVRLRVGRPDAQDALLQALRTVNKRAGAGSAPWRRPDASETIQAPQPHTTVSAA
jgi:histidinol-phosphate aminotransferase